MKYRDWEDSVIKGVAKSIHVDVDGRRMCKHPSLPHHTHGTIRGVYVAEDRQRPFLFAEVQTTGQGHPPFFTILPYFLCVIIQMKILYLEKIMQTPTR